MLNLIIGVKGTGKTKNLINMVNAAVENSHGDVVCIEKGTKLRFDVTHRARLINTEEYDVDTARSLYGFIAGILASNHDVTDVFVDSALKICDNDLELFDKFLETMNALASKLNVRVTMTSSIPAESASETVKKYL